MDVNVHAPFGTLLRRHRLAAGWSQERLAEQSGLSLRAISDLERGARRMPRLETVRMLADALGLDEEERTGLLRAARSLTDEDQDHPIEASALPIVARLPVPPTSLIGRERELATLTELLHGSVSRLVTLTGPGGVGKTRLALAAAHRLAADFADGVGFVSLAPLSDADLVASTIADALGIREVPGAGLPAALEQSLRTRHLLLVLDNVEHVLSAAPLVADLLAACPGLTVLTTSRVPLRLRGERQVPVPPLGLPDDGRSLTEAAKAAAVQLFVARAQAIRPDFMLDQGNVGAVVALCRRLDGLPLALELAAGRVGVLSPPALLGRLERRLPVLTGGPRDLPARQQTLEATIAWSYDLLSPEEQVLFRRLVVFAGGFTLEAAEAVVAPEGGREVFAGIAALVEASLVRAGEGPGGEPRFTMLETMREFAQVQLDASGEDEATRMAHAAWMLDLLSAAGPALVGPDQAMWLNRLDDELDNLRAALAWILGRGDGESALRLASIPWLFWFERGHATEGREWIVTALALAGDRPTAARAEALYAAGSLAATQEDYHQAEILLEAALADWEALDDAGGITRTRHNLGTVALQQDQNRQAARRLEQALSGYDVPPDSLDAPWVALAQSQLAAALSRLGDRERAFELAQTALTKQQAAGSGIGIALGQAYLGDIALDWGDHAEASARYQASLDLLLHQGDQWHLLHALTGFVSVIAHHGSPEWAARLYGAQAAARVAIGNAIPPRYRPACEAAVARLRVKLGEAAFATFEAEGAKLNLDEAVTEALAQGWTMGHEQVVAEATAIAEPFDSSQDASSPASARDRERPAPQLGALARLSPREVEVLRLVAAGKTDREIADTLFISRRTVSTHVTSIIAKLGVANRVQAAMVASQANLR